MTDTCNFCTCPTMKDSLIRDRIVLGIRKEDARKRLLQERKLDLKKCIDICRTSEGATTHMQAIGGKLEEVHWINKAKGPPKTSGRRSDRPEHLPDRSNSQSRKLKCKFCLKIHLMKKELCPAWGKRCSVCGKMNHWRGSEICERKDKVHSVSQDTDPSDSDSDVTSVKTLSVVINGVLSKQHKPIYCEMLVNSKPVSLQVDCGATVCIIPKNHTGDSPIKPSNISLEMWNKVKAAEKMNLITIDSTDILDEFPDIFNGDIGTLPDSVRLTLNSDAEPILRPPKRLPIELKRTSETRT